MEKIIHEEACDVLFFTGVKCNREIADLFEDSQLAWYDEVSERIHIDKKLISYCLEICQKRHNHPVPNRSFGGGGTAAFWTQGDDAILPTNEIHMADIFRLAEEFNVPFMFKGCGRVENDDLDIMRKYYSGYIYTEVKNEKHIEQITNYDNICTAHSIIQSPLKFMDTEKICLSLENDLPVYITSMPISCFTGPATIFSLAVLAWAEFLVGLCFCQIKRPSSMVVNGAYPAAGNPRRGYQPALGSIYHNLCNYWISKVSEYFSLPTIQSGCTTENKVHTPTEVGTDYDTYMAFTFWNSVDGWHQVRHCFGFINDLTDFDINKMRRDLVTLSRIIEDDIQFDGEIEDIYYDPETQEAIQEGSENGFKDIQHTIKNIGIINE